MKRLTCLQAQCITILLCGLCGTVSCGTEPGRIVCAEKGFSIQIPRGWHILRNHRGTVLLAEVPDSGEKPIIRQNLNVIVEEIDENLSLTEYVDGQILLMMKIRGFSAGDKGAETIDGHHAIRFTYEYTIQESGFKAVVYVLKKKSRGYVITGIAKKDMFERYGKVFEKTARSLKFL